MSFENPSMKNEKPKVVSINRGLELHEKNIQIQVKRIKEGIERLKEGNKQLEEWKRVALEQGDEKSALSYEEGIIKNEDLIFKGIELCDDLEREESELQIRHLKQAIEADLKEDSEEELERIESELEFTKGCLAFLLEEENPNEENKNKIEELKKRKEELEKEKLELK